MNCFVNKSHTNCSFSNQEMKTWYKVTLIVCVCTTRTTRIFNQLIIDGELE